MIELLTLQYITMVMAVDGGSTQGLMAPPDESLSPAPTTRHSCFADLGFLLYMVILSKGHGNASGEE